MESNTIQNLLQQVSAKRKHYDKIAEATGENFNIFKILKVQTKEVRLHSAFLAELLNPKGSHGQKDIFLNLFVKELKINDFDTSNAIIEVEKHAGWINEDCTEGGYIDLVITSSKKERIIIENKIYAGDQENQLFRYHQYDKNAHLFYLSLDGKLPTEWSTNWLEMDKHYKAISYKSSIINWLEDCKKESVNHPLLRETITQYINLLKILTNQSTNNVMSQDIKKVVFQNYEAYESAELICRELPKLRAEFRGKIDAVFWQFLQAKWEDKPLVQNFLPSEYEIRLEIGTEDGLHFGFALKINGKDAQDGDEYRQMLIPVLKKIDNEFVMAPLWIGWKYPKERGNFHAEPIPSEVFNLLNESNMSNFVDNFIEEINFYYEKFQKEVIELKPTIIQN